MPVYLLNSNLFFPPPSMAAADGLLAVGGDLAEERLLLAYQMGIFPWYSKGDPILWWSPDPRLVIHLPGFHVPRRLERRMRKDPFHITMDEAFERVIISCAEVHAKKDQGTWIVDEMIEAYCRLHSSGFAHSVEVWQGERLVGGLYGVSLGAAFFGESMFSMETDSSKAALVALARQLSRWSFHFIDCQLENPHLEMFGAEKLPRARFLKELEAALMSETIVGPWSFSGCRPG